MKIIINECYGGFGISNYARKYLGIDKDTYVSDNDLRTNPRLIELLERKGSDKVASKYAKLSVKEFSEPYYHICEYDGNESLYVSDSPIRLIYRDTGEKSPIFEENFK